MTQAEVKRLYRSRTNRMLAGVSGGLGEFLGLDATIVRLIFVFSTILLGGSGALVYFVMWLVVPEEPLSESARPAGMASGRQAGTTAKAAVDTEAAAAPKPKRKTATKTSTTK